MVITTRGRHHPDQSWLKLTKGKNQKEWYWKGEKGCEYFFLRLSAFGKFYGLYCNIHQYTCTHSSTAKWNIWHQFTHQLNLSPDTKLERSSWNSWSKVLQFGFLAKIIFCQLKSFMMDEVKVINLERFILRFSSFSVSVSKVSKFNMSNMPLLKETGYWIIFKKF